MQRIKDCWQKLSDKAKKVIIAVVTSTAAIAIIGVLALKFGLRRDYSTLFIGLDQEEAQQVIALFSEQGVDYRFNDREGVIRVSSANIDQIRTELLSMGYPKSSFSYGTYRNNTSLMTMESDKKQYILYELQGRLGTQIRLLDGVQDVRVTITKTGEPVYAYGDNTEVEAPASVVVMMMSGRNFSDNGATAIKNLIATSVRGTNLTNVAVLDADTMMEVGGRSDDGDYESAKDVTAFTSLVKNNIAANACRVLEKLYGQGKTAILVKGMLNMEKLIQKNTRYTAPEKIDGQDKTGLLYKEDTANENSGAVVPGNGGVVDADVNADTLRCTNQNGVQTSTDLYANNSAAREQLHDSVKEQRQVDLGVLGNTTIGIVINTGDTPIPIQDLINLVADSAGISEEEARQKITIIRAPSSSGQAVVQSAVAASAQTQVGGFPLPVIIAVITGSILILLLLVLLLAGRKRKKRDSLDDVELMVEFVSGKELPSAPTAETGLDTQYGDKEAEKNEQVLNLRTQRGLKLKQNIDESVDQNLQIATKLVQNWLRGEEDSNGGKCIDEPNSK